MSPLARLAARRASLAPLLGEIRLKSRGDLDCAVMLRINDVESKSVSLQKGLDSREPELTLGGPSLDLPDRAKRARYGREVSSGSKASC